MFKLKSADPLMAAVSLALLGSTGTAFAVDTGDAPESYGPAIHEIPPSPPHLGRLAPDDDGTAVTAGASADADDNDGNDDEDGVFAFPTLVENAKSYTTNVFASNPTNQVANIAGWIDFNGNGVFDSNEAAVATLPPGADNQKVKLRWNNLSGVTSNFTGLTYGRFRISTDVITPFDATGTFADGEVEDYALFVEADVDGDEIPDAVDPDNDNDGIPDSVEGITADTDGDGIPNYLDTDSDNDRIPDFIEAGGSPNAPLDSDGDGTPDYLDTDSNNDGRPDSDLVLGDLDGDGTTGEVEGIGDADGDGIINAYDLDSDNDTLLDSFETVRDTDGDGVPNFVDLDSDNDGIPDIQESSHGVLAVASLDTDGDGRVDPGHVHGSNGVVDSIETAIDSGTLTFLVADSDGDGLADFVDLDSDGDGISDLTEAGGVDSDNNSTVDSLQDSDGDTVPDLVDIDSVTSGVDADSDSIIDSADSSFVEGEDDDVDGIVDQFDPDADGNGWVDQSINNDSTGGVLPDGDGDGLPDFQDSTSGTNLDDTNGNGQNRGTAGIGGAGNSGSSSSSGGDSGAGGSTSVQTGLNGVAGCSVGGSGGGAFDPLLPALAVLAAGFLFIRRQSLKVRQTVRIKSHERQTPYNGKIHSE